MKMAVHYGTDYHCDGLFSEQSCHAAARHPETMKMAVHYGTDYHCDGLFSEQREGLRDWHRLFGLLLTVFFSGSPFKVDVERDLSVQQQLLDVVAAAQAEKASGTFCGLKRFLTLFSGCRDRGRRHGPSTVPSPLPAWWKIRHTNAAERFHRFSRIHTVPRSVQYSAGVPK
jgi:hypothetical protein